MRNPGESSEPRVESETRSEACAKDSERDDCDSPPCKRLKQAVLPFSVLTSSSLTSPGPFKTSVSTKNSIVSSSNSESKSSESCDKKPQASGGLVTGAPSPPDAKENSVKPQTTTDPSKVCKNLGLENDEDTTSGTKDADSVSSPESNSSSHNEEELMIIDQSPPAKVNTTNKLTDQRRTPVLKSAEKLKRKEEREKERQEKQRLKEEKLKEKQEAKAVKERERLEAKRKRDQERQEKQAERERKEKERVEKKEKEEKERLEKKEKRDEEKRKREEEKNAKVEEKRKREAEKRNIEEEQERKRQKTKETFVNFFTKTSTLTPKSAPIEASTRFKQFEVKTGMSLAPVIRRHLSLETKKLLDEGLQLQDDYKSYLRELEGRKPIPKYTKRRLTPIEEQPKCDSDEKLPEEAILVDDENSNSSITIIEKKNDVSVSAGLKNKLLQFHTNYRPAYYGTMRKKSHHISPKNPFKKDTDLLDYEVDSDDEWEEEEPGESLSDSEGEDEGDGDDDNNEDEDGFFVPHGYLSDDEGVEEGDDEESGENENKDTNSENKKDQQLAKAKAWEAEMKRKCKPMKPVALGCLWLDDATLNLTLKQFAACLLVDGPINVESSSSASSSRSNEVVPVEMSSSTNTSGALYVPDEAMPDLIKLVHGNTAGLNKIMIQFRKQWTAKCLGRDVTDEEVDEKSPISKRQLEKRIQNIATKERRYDRLRWYVHNHILAKFGLENLLMVDGLNSSDVSTETTKLPTAPPTNTPSIIQFTRPVSPALNRGASPELKNHTQNIKPVGSPCNSTSPMEVDNVGPSLCVNHQPADNSGCSNSANSHLYKESESQSKNTTKVCNKPGLITTMLTRLKDQVKYRPKVFWNGY
ncbi:uncharacterized protein LOC144651533 [Oculina patagonica]